MNTVKPNFVELYTESPNQIYFGNYLKSSLDVRKLLLLTIIVIFTIDFVFELTDAFSPQKKSIKALYIISLTLWPIATAIICFSLSEFVSKCQNQTSLHIKLNILAGILLGLGTLCGQLSRMLFVIETNEAESWTSAIMSTSRSGFLFSVCAMCMPVWYWRMIVPVCYHSSLVLGYLIDGQKDSLAWIILRNIANLFFYFALMYAHSQFRWKDFLRSNELAEWNKVYKHILDKNPSSIAVINVAGKVVYSNEGFQELSQNNAEDSLFKSLSDLKLRDLLGDYINSRKSRVAVDLQNVGSMGSGLFLERSFLRPLTATQKKLSRKSISHTIYTSFIDLESLLTHYRSLLDDGFLDNGDQIIFDGKFRMKKQQNPLKILHKNSLRDGNKLSERESKNTYLTLSYEVIIRPMPENKKLIVILNDTTERDIIANLENNSEYKDKILASVSHELRTPLNWNLGFLQAMMENKIIPKSVKTNYLTPAWRAGLILQHVIDDILDYSEANRDGISLSLEKKPLIDTFKYCFDLYEHAFKMKGLQLKTNFDLGLGRQFQTDHKRLAQVILNILSNALKFTVAGGATLEAKHLSEGKVNITIRDTGIGMTRENIKNLFGQNDFNKGFLPKEIQSKGVGLGLKVVHKLVQLLGDEYEGEGLKIFSEVGKGSCFQFTVAHKVEDDISVVDISNIISDKSQEIPTKGPETSRRDSFLASFISHEEIPFEYGTEDEVVSRGLSRDLLHLRDSMFVSRVAETHRSERKTLIEPKKTQKVLVVDDDPLNILVITTFLKQFGIPSEAAINGAEALSKVLKSSADYALILMDCQMPVMDGFEAAKTLTQKIKKGEIPKIPIIGCTAFNGQDKIQECLKSGMLEVMYKPVMREKLNEILKKYSKL